MPPRKRFEWKADIEAMVAEERNLFSAVVVGADGGLDPKRVDDVRFATATGSKEVRAKPVSAQAEAGNIKIVRAPWNDEFLRELENFPTGKHDDAVDALSGAHGALLAPTGGWSTATLAGTWIGGGTAQLLTLPIFVPRFSTNRF